MSAPFLWILLPLLLAAALWFVKNQRIAAWIAIAVLILLTLTAWLLPVDTVMSVGGFSVKITPAWEILGRRLVIDNTVTPLLALIFGTAILWFASTLVLTPPRRVIPFGLVLTALLVASLTVQPFLYAALFIEIGVLLAIPLLTQPGKQPGRGVIRFLIFQTLAMPFILFSGWLLTGIDANPGNLGTVAQAATLLALGFAFLLAVFPFYTWIPLLAEETHPFTAGLLFWLFPTATLFFGLGFLDHYAWLRESPLLGTALTAAGALMIVSGGLLAGFQRHLGKVMGYAVIVEIGFSLLAVGLRSRSGIELFLMLLVPRALGLLLWNFSLSILQAQAGELSLDNLKAAGRQWPYAAAGVLLGSFGIAGLPLLAGFPSHLAVWETLAAASPTAFPWVFTGSAGLILANIRLLSTLFVPDGPIVWMARETKAQKVLSVLGWALLVLLGILPAWMTPFWSRLPALFEHLGQ
jgi:formate hydrogenlyase subunit 3/multisubunit Na+/H+ antiporter MnhD subunit